MSKIYTAIGMMSGTSLDGVDIALIRTDGENIVERLDFGSYPYQQTLRDQIKPFFGTAQRDSQAEKLITDAHIDAIKQFGHDADLIGFHGQTIFHDPANRVTIQIGDGQALADATGTDVIYDFRSADVAAGGQGAPFLPLYHRVLAKSSSLDFPCAILNIGGVSNITWIGAGDNDILAFDTGPGNALLDDWMLQKTRKSYDANGAMALQGKVHDDIVQQMLQHPYFALSAPKSLDRDAFSARLVTDLSIEDGAATLAAFTVDSVARSFALLPVLPKAVYATGGGRKNKFMMDRLSQKLGVPVSSVDTLGWSGDTMEAEGFAYLAVRSLLGLPLSLPGTTGVPRPMTGGKLAKPLASVGSAA